MQLPNEAIEAAAKALMAAMNCEVREDVPECGSCGDGYCGGHPPFTYCTGHDSDDDIDFHAGALCKFAVRLAEAATPPIAARAWDQGAQHAWEASGEGYNGEYPDPGEPFKTTANPYKKARSV